MILLGARCPEQRHDAIAEYVIYGTVVALNNLDHHLQSTVKNSTSLLRSQIFNELQRTLDVREQNRDQLVLGLDTRDGLRRAARRDSFAYRLIGSRRP